MMLTAEGIMGGSHKRGFCIRLSFLNRDQMINLECPYKTPHPQKIFDLAVWIKCFCTIVMTPTVDGVMVSAR